MNLQPSSYQMAPLPSAPPSPLMMIIIIIIMSFSCRAPLSVDLQVKNLGQVMDRLIQGTTVTIGKKGPCRSDSCRPSSNLAYYLTLKRDNGIWICQAYSVISKGFWRHPVSVPLPKIGLFLWFLLCVKAWNGTTANPALACQCWAWVIDGARLTQS